VQWKNLLVSKSSDKAQEPNDEVKEKAYQTLMFVNLDGNFFNSKNEVLQWFV
jgi:hypothetical protein